LDQVRLLETVTALRGETREPTASTGSCADRKARLLSLRNGAA
jgi:hypothetical protein